MARLLVGQQTLRSAAVLGLLCSIRLHFSVLAVVLRSVQHASPVYGMYSYKLKFLSTADRRYS